MSILAAIALTMGALIIAVPIVLLICITAAIIVYWGSYKNE